MQSFVLDFAEDAVPRVTTTTKSRVKDLPLGLYGTPTYALCLSFPDGRVEESALGCLRTGPPDRTASYQRARHQRTRKIPVQTII